MEAIPRRQNQSCDRCRRSKRRCVLAGPVDGNGSPRCRNCARLGDRCTFDSMAAAQLAKSHGHVSVARTGSIASTTSAPASSCLSHVAGGRLFASEPLASRHVGNALQSDPYDQWIRSPSAADIFEEVPSEFWDDIALFNASEIIDQGIEYTGQQSPNSPHICKSYVVHDDGVVVSNPMSRSRGILDTGNMESVLDALSHALTSALHMRYLGRRTNALVGDCAYEIWSSEVCCKPPRFTIQDAAMLCPRDGFLQTSPRYDGVGLRLRRTSCEGIHAFEDSTTAPNPLSGTLQVSAVDAARFLDSLGAFYGNDRPRKECEEDEATLTLVMRAVALHHSPRDKNSRGCAPDHGERARSAWHATRGVLTSSMERRSFVMIHALLTFDLLVAPSETGDDQSLQLLDRALSHLQDLSSMVRTCCSYLHASSEYRQRLETCLQIMEWHAYVRDIVASLTSDRACVMEDLEWHLSDALIPPPYFGDQDGACFDEGVPATCETAMRYVFALYRNVVDLRTGLRDVHERASANITILRKLFDVFDQTFGSVLQQCLDNFSQLSAQSKVAAGYLTLFWHLGALSVFDVMNNVPAQSRFEREDIYFIGQLRKRAVESYAVILNLVMACSTEGDRLEFDVADAGLPFMAQHINTKMISFALQKAIQHTIQIGSLASTDQPTIPPDGLKAMCWGLLSLNCTHAGNMAAQPVVNGLLTEFGDTIMRSWTT